MDSAKALRIVQGLLAKAESTHSEHEAEALVAKARSLMLEHSIDEMRARERGRTGERPVVVEWEFSGSDSNAAGKSQLLVAVVKATGVRVVFFSNRRYENYGRAREDGSKAGVASQWAWLTGFENDVARAKMLYASLLVQAALFARQDFGKRPPSKVFTAFLMGYAGRVRQRLAEREPAPAETTALVVHRDEIVDAALAERFPRLVNKRSSGGADLFGRAMGHAAGGRADLGDRRIGNDFRRLS